MDNQNQQQNVTPEQMPVSNEPAPMPQPAAPEGNSSKKLLLTILALVVLLAGGAAAFLLLNKDDTSNQQDASQSQQTADNSNDTQAQAAIECDEAYAAFSDKEFGAAFCYPSDWGKASLEDNKFTPEDTGNRQIVKFSENLKFVVGGVSDDWTTTEGRGGSCLAPSNKVPETSEYNVEWHDITESFAKRSLETSEGGYSMVEMVGEFDNGVCANGYKVIDGSRYRVISASYYSEFTAGVANAAAHMEDPYVLFRETDRFELDKLLASVKAY